MPTGDTLEAGGNGAGHGGDQAAGPEAMQPKPRLRDDRQFIISITFILGFFVFIAAAFALFVSNGNKDGLTFMGTLFGGWVGTIIGYYFGQKPVEQVKDTLKVEQKRTSETQKWLQSRFEE